jgi:hypothetical protein
LLTASPLPAPSNQAPPARKVDAALLKA